MRAGCWIRFIEYLLGIRTSRKELAEGCRQIASIGKIRAREAFNALSRFKDNSWKALNSYVHTGIHPIRQHSEGYPVKLIYDVLPNANRLALMSAMQAFVLSGEQKDVLKLAFDFATADVAFR